MALRDDLATTPGHRRAGCPDVLEVDLADHDVAVRTTDWLDGPPTAHRAPARNGSDPDVIELTTTRAARLLDATAAHVQAAMEATSCARTQDRLDRAIADIMRARGELVHAADDDAHGTD